MDAESEQIRRLAHDLTLQENHHRRLAQQAAERAAQPPPETYTVQDVWDRHAEANYRLLGRFVEWAVDHNIDYDSPSWLARGWRLGVRGIALSTYRIGTSDGNVYDELSGPVPEVIGHEYSLRSLIVNPRRMGEIRITGSSKKIPEIPTPDLAARFQIAMPIDTTLGRYRPMTIVRSIARLSAKHGVVWDA